MAHEFMLDVIRRDIALCTLMFCQNDKNNKELSEELKVNLDRFYSMSFFSYLTSVSLEVRLLAEHYSLALCDDEGLKKILKKQVGSYNYTAENQGEAQILSFEDALNCFLHIQKSQKLIGGFKGSKEFESKTIIRFELNKDNKKSQIPLGKLKKVEQRNPSLENMSYILALEDYLNNAISFINYIGVKGASSLAGAGQRPADSTTNNTTTP